LSSIPLFAYANSGEGAEAAVLGIACLALLIMFPILLCIAGLIFRLSCQMAAVPLPSFPMAIGIEVVAFIARLAISMAVAFMVILGSGGVDQFGSGRHDNGAGVIAQVFSFPLNLLASAGVYSGMLNVSYGKGLLVWLCDFLIWLAISFCILMVALVAIVVLAAVATSHR
jgi:hypothetical protein